MAEGRASAVAGDRIRPAKLHYGTATGLNPGWLAEERARKPSGAQYALGTWKTVRTRIAFSVDASRAFIMEDVAGTEKTS